MTTFYLDFEGGNDANDGTTFANRWQTFTGGATAARIAPGDTIRIMASPDPTSVGSATWTNSSSTVTLAAAVTQLIDDCETAWTASASVTCTASTIRRTGSFSASMACAAGFTTGKIAFKALGAALDLSTYQQLTFWLRTSAATAANCLRIDLCSDTAGATPVNSFTVNIAMAAGVWTPWTIDSGGALGNNINSIAITALTDPGTNTILLDNINAVKAPSSADSLSLRSLISKNTDDNEPWFMIQGINGTTVTLGNGLCAVSGIAAAQKYYGTTETVTTYKRETVGPASGGQTLTDFGSASGGRINYEGGWDRTAMTTQNSKTFYVPQVGSQTVSGFAANAGGYQSFNKLYFGSHGLTAFWLGNGDEVVVQEGGVVGGNVGVTMGSTPYQQITDFRYVVGCGAVGVTTPATGRAMVGPIRVKKIWCTSDASRCFGGASALIGGTWKCRIDEMYGANYGYDVEQGMEVWAYGLTASGDFANGFNDHIVQAQGILRLINCVLPSGVNNTGELYIHRRDRVLDDHRHLLNGSTNYIITDTGTRHTSADYSWKFVIGSALLDGPLCLRMPLAKVAVAYGSPGVQVTCSVWVYRTGGSTARLCVRGGQLEGLTDDVNADASGSPDSTWEQLTVTFTPLEAGVFEVMMCCWGSAGSNVWVDDFSASQ